MILVAGEALYDLVLRGEDTIAAYAGGGPFNTARTIARLGQPAAFLGRLSTDRFGARLERMLAADGVEIGCVVHTDEPTTLALAEVAADGGARYRFYERGTSAPGLATEEALAALPKRVDMLHVGTLGLMLEPVAGALEAVVERLAPSALVALDPNVRPWAIVDADAYRARLGRVLANCHVLKLSEEDLEWLGPLPNAGGPAVTIVTRGAAGATVEPARGEAVEVPAPPVEVVDTIGAGDAFGGAFLAWWHTRGLTSTDLVDTELVVEATRFAVRVAGLTCGRAGASPPRLAELGATGS